MKEHRKKRGDRDKQEEITKGKTEGTCKNRE
jgi:hypothetical protein